MKGRRRDDYDPADIAGGGPLIYGIIEQLADKRTEPEEGVREDVSKYTPAQIEAAMDRLPPREWDILDLWLRLGKSQEDIATIFGVTQASVSYRVQRAAWRLRFFLDVAVLFTPEDIRRDLRGQINHTGPVKGHVTGGDALVEAFALLWGPCGWSQTEVGHRMGVTQNKVCHWLAAMCDRFLPPLVEANPKRFSKYLTGLLAVRGHWNVGRVTSVAKEYRDGSQPPAQDAKITIAASTTSRPRGRQRHGP